LIDSERNHKWHIVPALIFSFAHSEGAVKKLSAEKTLEGRFDVYDTSSLLGSLLR
jgi:hypothetical protein